jgi:hypothetical protein
VLAAVDAATRAGLIDPEELTHGWLTFPHTLTRQAVLDLIGPSRLTLLHAQAVEPADALLIIDPVDAVGDFGRSFQVVCELPFDHEDWHVPTPSRLCRKRDHSRSESPIKHNRLDLEGFSEDATEDPSRS